MTTDADELTCRDVAEILGRWLDGEMAPDERARFDEHLAECPDCVAYVRSYAATVRLAKDAWSDDDAPAELPDELRRAILDARASRAKPRR